jgi:hypothetical protein
MGDPTPSVSPRSLALALAHRDDLVGKTERMGVAHMRMYVITDDAC